ncbi:hypothetical protein Cob_v001688 [Colletotrichum orbiculare MAFF 240422]|uniref:Uncharacterized protein n=1 Tax=Colletotrichum orbiculare (strain 104-T / ATCC 96160 / CBS 514.97 / LARS 414 / MAFF 240422) TaxID=1213857 RepID=A0A484G4R3_COLOR|nr:hypothetical protein Cob_v001688 [Colletotrichum orbiculare MAFF 240422]
MYGYYLTSETSNAMSKPPTRPYTDMDQHPSTKSKAGNLRYSGQSASTDGATIAGVLLHIILFAVKQSLQLCYAGTVLTGTAFSAVVFFFVLSLPFGRQLEGLLRLTCHIIRLEMERPRSLLPAGGGTIRWASLLRGSFNPDNQSSK